ncbi:hypothetical protein Pmani_031296 [Petrolisthes manimaculis]|uniref:Uncharacterized protein n=1 Tax=Petrolisthes manimaculis TaxID=1843537 RepID=A0AAE1NV05_9EUCA|nr:hypothetical protein Pmani_031296 [Petrolisthes manimaculis]
MMVVVVVVVMVVMVVVVVVVVDAGVFVQMKAALHRQLLLNPFSAQLTSSRGRELDGRERRQECTELMLYALKKRKELGTSVPSQPASQPASQHIFFHGGLPRRIREAEPSLYRDSRELDTLVTANILSSSSPCLERQEDRGGGDNGMEVLRRFEAESMTWKNVNPFPRNMSIKKTLNGKVSGGVCRQA